MAELAGRIAVVTGGGKGIGAAIAEALAAAGADVAISGRDEAALERTAARVRELGRRALTLRCDVTVPSDVIALAARVRADLGAPHIVVANSGIARSAKLADTDEAMWHEVIGVNLTGTYRVAHAFG